MNIWYKCLCRHTFLFLLSTPILWPPDVKNWLIWKDPDAEKDRRWEKETTEGEMVGRHHRCTGHEFEQALGDREGQGSLACWVLDSPWGREMLSLGVPAGFYCSKQMSFDNSTFSSLSVCVCGRRLYLFEWHQYQFEFLVIVFSTCEEILWQDTRAGGVDSGLVGSPQRALVQWILKLLSELNFVFLLNSSNLECQI